MSALKADSPQWLAEHFIALPAMKFMQEILEIAGRRLFVPLQSKQPCDFVVVKLVHFFVVTRQGFSEIRPGNFATVGSRKRASNVPFLLRRARFY